MRKVITIAVTLIILSMFTATIASGYPGGLAPEYPDSSYNNGIDYTDKIAYLFGNIFDDGKVIWNKTGDEYVNVDWFNRTKYVYDDNRADGQSVEMTLTARAYIPCYLEMKVTGNQGQTGLKSYGPGISTKASASGYLLVFDNEIGGFVDEYWNMLGHNPHTEFDFENEDIFIQGCDVFKVEVYANDSYKYEVEGGPLTSERGSLPLHMRSGYSMSNFGGTFIFDVDGKIFEVAEKDACEELTVYHQFRVPFSRNIAQGRYDGKVIFRAYTL
ncbi:MAG: hypothetical protein GX202_03740 [Firmicutes bacterium]|nr:hypothetical protein [Bacillota bacterium]